MEGRARREFGQDYWWHPEDVTLKIHLIYLKVGGGNKEMIKLCDQINVNV